MLTTTYKFISFIQYMIVINKINDIKFEFEFENNSNPFNYFIPLFISTKDIQQHRSPIENT